MTRELLAQKRNNQAEVRPKAPIQPVARPDPAQAGRVNGNTRREQGPVYRKSQIKEQR